LTVYGVTSESRVSGVAGPGYAMFVLRPWRAWFRTN
jgi:hypothetical protein